MEPEEVAEVAEKCIVLAFLNTKICFHHFHGIFEDCFLVV